MDRRLRDGRLYVHARGVGCGDGAVNYRELNTPMR